jgi:hypothetical protein
MYSRDNVFELIKMIEIGLLRLDGREISKFALEDWEEAFATAAEYSGSDRTAVFIP